MSTCFVHIGAPKTGSTAIQRLLCENQDLLQAQGVLYPDVCLRGYGHHDLALSLNGEYPLWARDCEYSLDDLVSIFRSVVEANPGKNFVLSSENFYLYPQPLGLQEVLSKVLPDHEIKIIVYIREQVSAHESWFNQTIKAQGFTHNIQSCVRDFRDLWDYNQNLALWTDVFGTENVSVSVYDDQVDHVSFLNEFLEKLGVDQADIQHQSHRVNERLSATVLEFQRLLNRLPISIISKRAFHKQLIELSRSGIGRLNENDVLLDRNLADKIVAEYRASNLEVAQRFFRRDDLFSPRSGSEIGDKVASRLSVADFFLIVKWLIARNFLKRELENQT